MATKSSGSAAKKSGTAKKATKATKATRTKKTAGGGESGGGGGKLTLSRQTLRELETLVQEAAAARQSQKVCIA